MLFNSFEFLIFLPLVTLLFYLLPVKYRWVLLLIASCVFYCYFIPIYLLILVFTVLIDYAAGIKIEHSNRKKIWLTCSIIANIGILFVFKYYNFFIYSINKGANVNLPFLSIILPIGLSFHTFQALSYTIEVYRGNYKAERHLGIYALYVLFYPQLVAGPIERPQNVIPQLKKNISFNPQNLIDGLRLITWGFFKKLVIADKVSQYVSIVYNHPDQYNSWNVVIAIFFFSLQIYCDFSGYTDIARGAAKMIGYNLMINFNRPFLAGNVREFWQRWHISLSSWFRDYVYIPLGGSRGTTFQTVTAILVVFGLSGFWHGAGWNFIIWGLLHGFFVISYVLILQKHKKRKTLVGIVFTNILVAYTFVFFRTDTVGEALEVIKNSLYFSSQIPFQFGINSKYGELGFGNMSMAVLLFYIIYMLFYEYKTSPSLTEMNRFTVADTMWFAFTIISIILFGVFTKETFIYFQF